MQRFQTQCTHLLPTPYNNANVGYGNKSMIFFANLNNLLVVTGVKQHSNNILVKFAAFNCFMNGT